MNSEQAGTSPSPGHSIKDWLRLTLIGVAALISFSGVWRSFLAFDAVAIVATVVGGLPVYLETFRSLWARRINMEASMALAMTASLLIGQLSVAVLITFFVTLAEIIEGYSIDRGRATLQVLERSAPQRALVRRLGEDIEVPVASVQFGEVVIVREGDRIPVDGNVVKGSAFVNQSSITGEANRVAKTVSEPVFAGTVNESGLLEVRTVQVGPTTVFGQIIRLMEEAESRKAPIEKTSDKLATRLVLFAIGFSAITFLLTRNVLSAISVIVVAGACGVAAGTPLAILATMQGSSRRGVLIKGGLYLEELSRVDTVVVDKTGTLTIGEPRVVETIPFGAEVKAAEVLGWAGAAERRSSHPVGRSLVAAGQSIAGSLAEPEEVESFGGQGVRGVVDGATVLVGNLRLMEAQGVAVSVEIRARYNDLVAAGRTVVIIARLGTIVGIVGLADQVRPEAALAVRQLQKLGVRIVMLTGDNAAAASEVARVTGISEVRAGLLPKAKVEAIEGLVASGRIVAMVGDGVNDAPGLARANVGIGMGGGADVAVEEADVVLLKNDLLRLPETLAASRKARRTIFQNFYGTVGIDSAGMVLALVGILTPFLAAIIHVTSEMIFLANSTRLMR